MTGVRAILVAFLLATTLATVSLAQQHDSSAPAPAKVAELFPKATGTLSLQEKVGVRLDNLGVKLINYEVLLEGKKAGEVTRIVSLREEGLAANLDMLARYDVKGVIQGIVSLRPWPEGGEQQDLTRLLWSLRGQDLRTNQAALVNMITGLAAGTALADGMAPPPPAGGYPLSVKQLLLERGAKLPFLKVTDLSGKSFDSSTYRKSKLLISFLSPENSRSGEMAQAVEKVAAPAIRNKKVAVLHIISAPEETAAEYVKSLGLKSTAAADPAGLLARMFQVPYSPYLFMFNKGVLTAPVTWEGEQKLQGVFSQFLQEGGSTVKGASK
jgi:hypothetical protein